MSKRPGAIFQLLIGGRCRAWDLRTRGGRWPAEPRSAVTGGGYVVSGHPAGAGGSEAGSRALDRATDALLAVAASMRRPL